MSLQKKQFHSGHNIQTTILKQFILNNQTNAINHLFYDLLTGSHILAIILHMDRFCISLYLISIQYECVFLLFEIKYNTICHI